MPYNPDRISGNHHLHVNAVSIAKFLVLLRAKGLPDFIELR